MITDNNWKEHVLPKLQALYPERKVFALSSLDDDLRELLNRLYQEMGYSDLHEFLAALGYEMISGTEVRELRNEVIYSPGSEPEPVRTMIRNMCSLLDQYYTDRIIRNGIQAEHKSLSGRISGLYQWLGYANIASFLEAYGYSYNVKSTGRPENDYQTLIDTLLKKYEDRPRPKNIGILMFENPELRGQIKTLQNKAPELFGMSLKAFLTEVGLFEEKEASRVSAGTGSSGVSKQDEAMSAMRDLYNTLDPSVYGTYEQAQEKLNGITIKQNKAGQIYVFRVLNAPETLEIPYGVNLLSKAVLKDNTTVKRVIFPDTVQEIPEEAFAGCTSLQEVKFGNSLEQIGPRAFYGCTGLTHISFPASLKFLGKESFAECSSLESADCPNPMMRVESDSFRGCIYTHEVLSDTESTPAEYFKWTPLKKDYAVITGYHGNDRIIRIPSFIEGKQVTTLGTSLFQGNPIPKEIYVPDTVTVLQKDVFRECPNLETVHLSENISKITTTMFSGCTSLRKINIPDSVSELKKGSFRDSPVTDVHIGKSMRILSPEAFGISEYDERTGSFRLARNLKNIDVDAENPYLTAKNGCVYSRDGKELITGMSEFHNISIPEGTERIAESAFANMRDLTDISFPESLREIGAYAFYNSGLRSIRIGRNVRKIEEQAFGNSSNLSSVIFEDGIEEIGDGAFDNCPIVSVTLPSTIRSLGNRSFSCFGGYNDRMMGFRIAENNPYLHTDGTALYRLDGEKKILVSIYDRQYRSYEDEQLEYTVEPGTTHIADEACMNCSRLAKVTLPEGLISIGDNAFAFTGVSSLYIPSSLQHIGETAFSASENWDGSYRGLDSVTIAEGNTWFFIQDHTLYMNLPEGGSELLLYFGEDDAIVISSQTVKIEKSAFAYRSVKELTLPRSVREIGEDAFKGCENLSRIRFGTDDESGQNRTAVIYLPKAESESMFWTGSIRDQFMDCIRFGMEGNLFDFEKYDSLFPAISRKEDKVLVAVDRLKSAVELDPVYAENYRRYLQEDADLSVRTVITQDDTEGLELLGTLDCIDEYRIDRYIELANKTEKTAAQMFLMSYKNDKIGFDDSEFKL